ncbi:MAG: NADPH-dependent 7-cyano-7-deazaguanine reductase QueF [Candidatus Omnitrophica bacterium]|nr:NADPH-dependent 7-cyano-7-deazaguanine reductase QueF [Candidatus Omnitrophota bacterium]
MPTKKSSYENLQAHVRTMKIPGIEVWENQYAGRNYTIHLEIPEFTCICPKTGLPDFGAIVIDYIPAKTCLELKSLKMYIIAYRDKGIFHEHLVNRILDDLVAACQPKWMRVEGNIMPRGGIHTMVSAEYKGKKLLSKLESR